jgi:hypothetical protein
MTVVAGSTTDPEALARIDRLITQVMEARTVAEVKLLGRELVRQVEEYRRAHPRRA